MEEAAQVLQRFYRKWKLNKDKSVEEESSPMNSAEDWTAPFRLVENRLRDIRSGRSKRREKVNMAAHRKEMILAGLASQEFENLERDTKVAQEWQNVITRASKDPSSTNSLKRDILLCIQT